MTGSGTRQVPREETLLKHRSCAFCGRQSARFLETPAERADCDVFASENDRPLIRARPDFASYLLSSDCAPVLHFLFFPDALAMPRFPRRGMTLCFASTTLISAFLVFQVQPVISKIVLPWFGGSPAVWTTCMLFFQVVLFAGYAYAHFSARFLKPWQQGVVHFALLAVALCLLPITPSNDWNPDGNRPPAWQLFGILGAYVGLPYFILSATGPLLQYWFGQRLPGESPYRLYALSNLGSLAALLSYPFLVEPSLSTNWQGQLWSLGFCVFAISCGYLAAGARGTAEPDESIAARAGSVDQLPSWAQRVLWLVLPALASVVLLATTNHLCQDIAVIPFLWIAPLSLYLLTFIICFDRESWYSRRLCATLATASAIGLCIMIEKGLYLQLLVEVTSYLSFLFWVCMVCHGELVRNKPAPRYVTAFYLMMSAGGALGGVFVAVICPRLFSTHWEMNLSIFVAAAVAAYVFLYDARLTWLGDTAKRRCVATLALSGIVTYVGLVQFRDESAGDIACVRTFYGVLHIREDERDPGTVMIHGRTMHGFQFAESGQRRQPTTYYGRRSGVGVALKHVKADDAIRVGAVGLGCGTIAAYGQSGDYYRFYEINPAVVDLAKEHFSYLADCEAQLDIVLGDARLSLEHEPPQDFDVLVLDAFSSDSIPTHLLTREAVDVYRQHLKPDGVLAVHISNRNLNLAPVVLRLAEDCHMQCVQVVNPNDRKSKVLYSKWMLLTNNQEFLALPEVASVVRFPHRSAKDFPLWTDQYNNLFQILTIF